MQFSLVIPCYNVQAYIAECLESVSGQTFSDWECICVDDGSTDGTAKILDQYAQKDKRFRVFHQPNTGVSTARNFGIAQAKGHYVGFVDADDAIAPDWLKSIGIAAESSYYPDWIRGKCQWCHNDLPKTPESNSANEETACAPSDKIIQWGWLKVTECGCPFVNFYKREVLPGNPFSTDLRIHEDDIFTLSMLPHVHSACEIDYAGYYYRCARTDSSSKRGYWKDSTGYLIALKSIFDTCATIEQTDPFAIRQHFSYLVFRDLMWLMCCLRNFTDGLHDYRNTAQQLYNAGLIDLGNWPKPWRIGYFSLIRFNFSLPLLADHLLAQTKIRMLRIFR